MMGRRRGFPKAAWGFIIPASVLFSAVAAAVSAEGQLDAATPLTIEGRSASEGPHALLVASGLVEGPPFRVAAGSVTVEYYERTTPMVEGVFLDAGSRVTSLGKQTYEAADIRLSRPTAGAHVVTYDRADEPAARSRGSIETSRPVVIHARGPSTIYAHDAYQTDGSFLSIALTEGNVTITGDFSLHAWGVQVRVEASGSSATYATGDQTVPSILPVHERRERWIVAALEDATFTLDPSRAIPTTLYLDEASVGVTGSARLEDAQGRIRSAGMGYEADGNDATLAGNLTFHVRPGHGGSRAVNLPGSEAPRFQATVSGELWETSLEGFLLPGHRPLLSPSTAGTASAMVLLSLLAGRFAWVSYWRLKPDAVLGNEGRRRLFELAQARPGLCVREAAREAGLSKTTAHYHLNVLAKFGLVGLLKDAPDSRTLRVFVLGDEWLRGDDPESRALALALARRPCLRVARLFVDRARGADGSARPLPSAGVSMSLAEASRDAGLPKPTVLRHLRVLAKAGVLEIAGEGPRTRRYALTPEGLHRLRGIPGLEGAPAAPAPRSGLAAPETLA